VHNYIGLLVELHVIKDTLRIFQITPTTINPILENEEAYLEGFVVWERTNTPRIFINVEFDDPAKYYFPADIKVYELSSWIFQQGDNILFMIDTEHMSFMRSLRNWMAILPYVQDL